MAKAAAWKVRQLPKRGGLTGFTFIGAAPVTSTILPNAPLDQG
jgi:hypothetical protein